MQHSEYQLPVRHRLDREAGVLSFDMLKASYQPRRLRVLWIENNLDCRMWAYYCDIRQAMAELHELCTPRGANTCIGRGFKPDVAIIGPRFSINVQSENELVGFDRSSFPRLPLLILQNKMYVPKGWKEIVGNATAKLSWANATGAAAAFTWLTRHIEFTRASGVPHHWLPFGVDVKLFGRNNGTFGRDAQPIDLGFTGAAGKDKYPLRSELLRAVQTLPNVSTFFGTWSQTSLNRADARSWKAPVREGYAMQIAKVRIWLSTLGPSSIVGTRYFEILASGTTLLMCNRPPAGLHRTFHRGLFQDGVHVVMFDDVEDMKAKALQYLQDEPARQRIVTAAYALATRLHTWNQRARFISRVAEEAIENAKTMQVARFLPSPGLVRTANDSSYVGCFVPTKGSITEPVRSRNKRKLWRYTVAECQDACQRTRTTPSRLAAVTGGGFVSGNGHKLAECMCAKFSVNHSVVPPDWRRVADRACSTTCTLLDARPCGGYNSYAIFRPRTASSHP